MRKTGKKVCSLVLAAVALMGIAALSAAADTTKVKGLIVGRDGADIIVKGDMASWTIELNDDTKVQAIKGKLGLRKDELGITDLVPGLPVEVETINSGSTLVAISIKFKADDLKTARQIQAGLNPTAQQLQGVQGDQAAMSKKLASLATTM